MASAAKTKDLISFSHQYSIVPAKLTILYKRGASLEEIYKAAIVPFPVLLQMEKPNDNYLALVFKSEISNEIFLFINDEVSFSIIAHECVHIVSRIFEIVGSPITEATEEFFAYLLDYTFEQISIFCTEQLKLKLSIMSNKQ